MLYQLVCALICPPDRIQIISAEQIWQIATSDCGQWWTQVGAILAIPVVLNGLFLFCFPFPLVTRWIKECEPTQWLYLEQELFINTEVTTNKTMGCGKQQYLQRRPCMDVRCSMRAVEASKAQKKKRVPWGGCQWIDNLPLSTSRLLRLAGTASKAVGGASHAPLHNPAAQFKLVNPNT